MKTIIFTHLNINNNGINHSITTKNSYENYDQAAGDMNRNATASQLEHERNACEEELYKLRFGIENLLANNGHGQGDSRGRRRQRFANIKNPFRTMSTNTIDWINRKKTSWFNRCSRCCRCGKRNSRKTPQSSRQSQRYNDPLLSPSMSSRSNLTENDLQRNLTDPAYNSVILKILEGKALDCLCAGYSKETMDKQIAEELSNINQRGDSGSGTTNDGSLSTVETPYQNDMTSPFVSPDDSQRSVKSSSKSNKTNKSRKKKSKVTIRSKGKPRSKKSKSKKKSSSKKSRKPSSKSKTPSKKRSKSIKGRSSSKSKQKKTPSKSRSGSKSKKKGKSKKNRPSSKKKRTKSKSNNQMNDHEIPILPTFIYPQSYQEIYRTRQVLLEI